MTKLNRINQEMVEEVLPTGTTSGTNPYDYGKVEAKKTEKKVYTQAEMDEAVKAEREVCAEICEGMLFEDWTNADRQVLCADAIRVRGD